MGIDYYGVLNLNKCATEPQIKQEYRRLALKLHPDRKPDEEKCCEETCVTFALVGEAYDVLSDKFLRAVYDQYGEEGLKRGVPGPREYIQPYTYHGDSMRTYREFFGTLSPHADLLDVLIHPLPLYKDGIHIGVKTKDPDVYHPLPLTLEEVFHGGVKQAVIRKRELCEEDSEVCPRMTRSTEVLLAIKFPPGVEPKTEYRFQEAADVIFMTEDIPHPIFKREGVKIEEEKDTAKNESKASNGDGCITLCLSQEEDEEKKFYSKLEGSKNGWKPPLAHISTVISITLCQALTGFMANVSTIDGRLIRIPVTDIVTPTHQMVIPGEGLPILGDQDHRKGDLRLRFDIKFPILPLPKNNRKMIQEALSPMKHSAGMYPKDINSLILRDKMNKVALKEQAPPFG